MQAGSYHGLLEKMMSFFPSSAAAQVCFPRTHSQPEFGCGGIAHVAAGVSASMGTHRLPISPVEIHSYSNETLLQALEK
jgi:hypothetical protein